MSSRHRIDPSDVPEAVVSQAVEILRDGGLVVSPTETRYGILARADRRDVLEKVYSAKGRDVNKPTSLLVEMPHEVGMLGKINRPAGLLIKAFLPGPLTLVVPSLKQWFPPAVVDGKVGVRCSPMPLVGALARAVDVSLTATSANLAGSGDFDTVDEIEKAFGDQIDLYIDAGPLTGPTSTVVDCSTEEPVILREGAIERGRIEAALI